MAVRVDYTLPTQRTDGVALPVSQIAFVRFSLSLNGGAFANIADVPATAASYTYTPVLAPGNYVVRSVVYDTQTPARTSTAVDSTFTIAAPVLAAPRPVSGQTATVAP